MTRFSFLCGAALVLAAALPASAPAQETRVPVVFGGGHDTDPRDGGRPVVLVAGALNVPPEVFREAFTHVHPAGPGSGGPTPDEARANKKALMDALGKYGVTNARLDEVSNYYRYARSRGEMWPVTPAVANAVVKGGFVIGYEVVSGGSGYTTPPTVTVPGYPAAGAQVTLGFGADFAGNGTVMVMTAVATK